MGISQLGTFLLTDSFLFSILLSTAQTRRGPECQSSTSLTFKTPPSAKHMPDKTSRLCTDPHSCLVSNSVLSVRSAHTEGCYPCIPARGRQCHAPPACSFTAAISHPMLHTIQTFQRKTFLGKANSCKNSRYNHTCSPGTILLHSYSYTKQH